MREIGGERKMSEKERKGQGLPRRGSWLSLGERGVLITAGTGVDV